MLARLARDIAVKAGDVRLALRAADHIASHFDVVRVEEALRAAQAISKETRSPEQHEAFCSAVLPYLQEAFAAETFAAGSELATLNVAEAKASRNAKLVSDASDMLATMNAAADAREKLSPALEKLATDAAAPAANAAAGRYYCFVKEDWAKGLPYLALGSDKVLAEVAARELEKPSDQAARLQLADAWWDAADALADRDQRAARRHAAGMYRTARPANAGGLTGIKAQKRIDEAAALPSNPLTDLTYELPGTWIDLLSLVDLKGPGVKGKWQALANSKRLWVQQDKEVRATIPLKIDCDRSYVFRAKFVPMAGEQSGGIFVLPVRNDKQIVVIAAPNDFRILRIYGQKPGDEIIVKHRLTLNVEHTLQATIVTGDDTATIKVVCDGKTLIDWTDTYDKLQATDGRDRLEAFRTTARYDVLEFRAK
jgi:hypothetical protein